MTFQRVICVVLLLSSTACSPAATHRNRMSGTSSTVRTAAQIAIEGQRLFSGTCRDWQDGDALAQAYAAKTAYTKFAQARVDVRRPRTEDILRMVANTRTFCASAPDETVEQMMRIDFDSQFGRD